MTGKKLTTAEKRALEDWQDLCRRIRQGVPPPPKESEVAKKKRIERLLKPENFPEFARYYFPDYCSADFAWFHRQAWHEILEKRQRLNIWEWPRESAKSVFADVLIVCHLLFTGWLKGLILASETEDKANKLIGDVEAQLRENPRILADFGDFGVTGSWIQGYFSTSDGIGFWAFGVGQNPAGVRNGPRRPNLGIVDDADSKKVAKNQQLTKERVDWIQGEFMGCLATEERMFIYANNRVHRAGITAHLAGDLEEGQPLREGYNRIKVYFTEDPETHEMLLLDQGGVPAWRERFTVQMARDKITDMGHRNAMRQLYHQDIPEGERFTDEMLPWVDPLPLSAYDALVTYLDPAYGESDKGCFRGLVLVGVAGLDYHVLWAWVRQTGNFAAAQYELADSIACRPELFFYGAADAQGRPSIKVRKVKAEHWVESNELQKIVLKKIYQGENTERGFAWWPKFDMEPKGDKIGRIEALEPLAENGHLGFSRAQQSSQDMRTLRDQFISFPNGFVDGPDAVEGAISRLRKMSRSGSSKLRGGSYDRRSTR